LTAKAYVAVGDLADRPNQGVALLKKHLRPVAPIPADHVRRLIAVLNDEKFTSRQTAERMLAALGPQVWPTLREALAQGTSLEARRRLERLLSVKPQLSGDDLRRHRALRALEMAGTTQARDLLAALASGDPAAPLTQEAKGLLDRTGRRLPAEDARRP
jgi:hypothetical protein